MAYKVIATGLEEVERRFKDMIDELADPDKILRTAVANQYQTISERIQQQGENTGGAPIQTGYAAKGKRRGAYSQGYSYKRQKDGRQISKMDFTMTGDLLDRGFVFVPVGRDGYGLGFANSAMYQRAQYLEERFGSVFFPSKKELDDCLGFIQKAIKNALKK